MNEQLERQIQADFPFMKMNKIDGEENLYRRWGCDCDDGWYELIHDMCQAITDRYAKEGLPIDLIPTQLKEKFATLRFYYSFEGSQYGSAAIDFLGSMNIRFKTNDDTPLDDRTEKLRRDIAQIIRTYEAKSKTVCEKCGNTDSATIRKDLGWWRTLCKSCYEKRTAARVSDKNKINKTGG